MLGQVVLLDQIVFPAYAGMDRTGGSSRRAANSVFPAYAGMDRLGRGQRPGPLQCSPHTRGWTAMAAATAGAVLVFPAYAGMDRPSPFRTMHPTSVPRIRGDGPLPSLSGEAASKCSPHTRGWTARVGLQEGTDSVFPAYAGMDRRKSLRCWSG